MEMNDPFAHIQSDKPPEDLRKTIPQKKPLDAEVAAVITHPIEPYSTRKHKEAEVAVPPDAKTRPHTAHADDALQATWMGPRESDHASIYQQHHRTVQHLETIRPPEGLTPQQKDKLRARAAKLQEFLSNPCPDIGKPEPLSRQQQWDVTVANEQHFNTEQKFLKRWTLDAAGNPVEIPRKNAKYVMTAADEWKAIQYALNPDADQEEEQIANLDMFTRDHRDTGTTKTFMLNMPDGILDPSQLMPSVRQYYEHQMDARAPLPEELVKVSGRKAPDVVCGAPTKNGGTCKADINACRWEDHAIWREQQKNDED